MPRFTFGPKSGVRMRQVATAGGLGFVSGVTLTTLILAFEDALGVFTASSEVVAILLGVAVSVFVRLILLRSFAYRTHRLGVGAKTKPAAACT